MGIMPVDRDQKLQRVFRRFGLPDASPEREEKTPNGERRPAEPDKRPERKDPPERR
ncbi:MAG TPA: hypothetical protein VKT77_08275 [Chthonomonadaceae bacterium]|nr:hypothetical protein [Chthonomonadaceae bacterium]